MDKYKILHNESITTSGSVTVSSSYTVPVASSTTVGGVEVAPLSVSRKTQTLLTTLFVCNTDAADSGTFDIKVSSYDASSPVVTKLYNGVYLYFGNTVEFGLNLTLKAGDIVTVEFDNDASTVTYDVTMFGIEKITGSGPDA